MRLPPRYVVGVGAVMALLAFLALTALGVLTFESLYLLLATYVFQVFAVTVLAALGGVFLGMVLAHRMLASRAFSPFERDLLETLGQVRARLDAADRRDRELMERLEGLEKRLR